MAHCFAASKKIEKCLSMNRSQFEIRTLFFPFFRLVADYFHRFSSGYFFSIPQEKVADFEGVMMAFMGIFYAGMGAGQARKSSNDDTFFSSKTGLMKGGYVYVYIYSIHTIIRLLTSDIV